MGQCLLLTTSNEVCVCLFVCLVTNVLSLMIAVFDNMLLEILRKTREEINGTIYNKHV